MNRRGESCEVKHRKRSVGKFPWAVKSAMPIPSSITCGTRFQCSTGTDLVKPGIAYLKIHTAPKTAPHAIPPLHQLPRPPRRRFVAVVHRIAPPDRFERHEPSDHRMVSFPFIDGFSGDDSAVHLKRVCLPLRVHHSPSGNQTNQPSRQSA